MSRFGYRSMLAALLTFALLLFLQPVTGQAASSDAALKILKLDGIKGSYSNDPYKGASVITSYSFESESTASLSKGLITPSKPEYSDITITKVLDDSSPALLRAAAKGTVIPNGYLYFVSPDRKPNETYMIIHFTNLVVTGYEINTEQQVATEVITMHAESILFKYTMYDAKGKPKNDQLAIGEPVVTSISTQYHFDPIYATTNKGHQYIEGFHVSLKATATKSNIESTRYRINGGDWVNYNAPFDIYAVTTHTVEYYSTDEYGNNESINIMNFDSGTFKGNGKY